jgi:PAS domain S-box-containing protein
MTTGVEVQNASEVIAEPSQGRIKLLLVDDDRDNLLALQAVLEPLGQQLMLASSGLEALRLCLEHDFAAMLLDVRMPEMDGFETAELIRARKRSSHTPILFLTGYRSDEQLFRGYDLGAVDFLFKPIVPEVLQSKVAVFVELSRKEQLLRRKTEALERTEQRFRAVLEAAPDAMVITDENGVIQLANSRTDSLFGYEREELLGTNIRALIAEWNSVARPQRVSSNGSLVSELRLNGLCRDGSTFPAQITINPFEADGRFITTAIRDASEQVQAEERILRINAELEKRVAERTVDLMRSNDALRQFAWAASHDLQEPTRMVLAYSQWLGKTALEKLTQKERDMLTCVEENGHRLQTLLAALRDYIYISESGDEPWAQVDCNAVVANVLANLEGAIAETNAIVTSDPLPTLTSIQILLVQLFQNLISNAIKYRAADRAPEITISSRPDDRGCLFSVRDNGIGIEPQHREYVFNVFKRLHGRKYAGTGIGLAICKAAVERLGGRIWVDSDPGQGCTFYFSLPQDRVA